MDEKSIKQFEELDKIRSKIAGLKTERVTIEGLQPPVDLAIAAKEAEINSGLDQLCDPEYHIRKNDTRLLLIGIFSTQLKENIAQHMRQHWPKETATDEQKRTRIAALAREILKLEVVEERLVCNLEADGVAVTRRPVLDPRVFFEVIEDGEI